MVQLTDMQNELKNEFREFVDRNIVPIAKKNDIEEKLDESIINNIRKKGYLGSMIPKKYGGRDFDSVTIGILNEEIG